jgi:outer membrane protein TolC
MNLVISGAHATARSAIYSWLLGVLAMAWPLGAQAAGDPLSLDAAIDRALMDSPQVSTAQASLEGAQSLVSSAGRLPDPEVLVGVENLPANGADRFSLDADFMTMRKVGLMQSVPAGAKRRFQSQLASREADVARAELRATRFETAAAAAEAWIATAAADQTLARFRTLRGDLGLQSAAARAGLSSGRSNAADALASESALARLDSDIFDLERQLAAGRAALARWIGADAGRSLAEFPWRRDSNIPVKALMENLTAHPPLAPVAARLEAARTEVDLARAAKRPDWSAELSFAKRGPDYSDMVSLEFRVGLPFFSRNRQDPVIAAKLANVRADEAKQEAALRMHRAEIEVMDATWRLGHRRLEHFEATLLPLARDRSRMVLSAYGSGRGDMRAALEALRDELDLQREYVALEAEVTRAWTFLHLLHSTGSAP